MIRALLSGFSVLALIIASAPPAMAAEEPQAGSPGDSKAMLQDDFSDLPTFIKSDNLTLKSEERLFIYSGQVEVKQGDMILNSDTLEGRYSKDNKIEQLVAKDNVIIVKGDGIRANSQRAVYDAATETVTLTESPELQQNGSVLTADTIKIFLKDNRSTAEGAVRVKLEKEKEESETQIPFKK
ncbi:MAG: hypothetical protein J5J00_07870 [Deltaproteobacteria bacterium]|nr:hypothetical protein [Deltaproteobacteria bacterium]